LSIDSARALSGAPYLYSDDNPVSFSDPSGLLCFDPTGTLCPLEHELAVGVEHALSRMTFGLLGSSSLAPCTTATQIAESLTLVGGLFVPGEDELDAGAVLRDPNLVKGLSPAQVDDLGQSAGYDVAAGRSASTNPATRYYVPGTAKSEGFRILPEGVAGQSGLKSGPYLRYFGGPNDGIGVPLSGG
jgi:hypothetical protein